MPATATSSEGRGPGGFGGGCGKRAHSFLFVLGGGGWF